MGLSHELWILEEQPPDGRYQFEVNFPYLSKDHVYVYVDENGPLRDYFWIGNNRIEVELFDTETELPLGSEVYVVRRTPIYETLVDYQGGQILDQKDLDVSYLQVLYVLQEVFEGIQVSNMTYRPINVDKHTVLEMLEGELTKSHLFQALIDELDLISVLHGGQSDLYDSVQELFADQGILQGSVADISTTVEDHGSSIDAISATINEQSTNIAAVQLATDDNTASITDTVGRLDLEEQRGVVIEQKLWVGEEGDNGLITDPSPNSLMGQYTLKMQLDTNGEHRVAGFGLSMEEAIDSNNLSSEFMILADRFRIVSPNHTNALLSTTVFTVGQVNSEYKCGIRGDLIVENSIDSRSLRTNDITLEHFSTTTQEEVKNTSQRWDHIKDLPDYSIVGSQTLISPGSILLANGTSTLDELTAEHVVETFDKKWAAESGADVTGNSNFVTSVYPSDKINLQDQIDGKITTWFQSDNPNTWPTADRAKHNGDVWYKTSTNQSYRYDGTYNTWYEIKDQDALDAISNAAQAQDTADGKRRTFTTWETVPTPPYDTGDLWVRGPQDGVWSCKQKRLSGETSYLSDWMAMADETQSRLTSGADITNARANGEVLIQGGYIAAEILQVGTAEIIDAAIVNAKIGDLEVSTLKIAGGAITVPVATYETTISTGNNNWQVIASVVVTMDTAGDIQAIASASLNYGQGARWSNAAITINSTSPVSQQWTGDTATSVLSLSQCWGVGPGTYTIRFYWQGYDNAVTCYNKSLTVLGVKR